MSGFRGSRGQSAATYVKLGIFTVVALLSFALVLGTMQSPIKGDVDTYTAEFGNVSGLKKGDAVRVAGVSVGKVTSISVRDARAYVEFELKKSQPLLSTARLTVRYQNLVGQRYLDLDQQRSSGNRLHAGATIDFSHTSAGFNLTELLNGFRPLFDVLDPEQINQLATTVLNVLQGQGGTVPVLLDQTAQLTRFVADRDAVFERVLDNLTPFLKELESQGDEFAATVKELESLMRGLAQQRDTLGASVSELSTLLTTSKTFLDNAERPTRELTRNLRSASTAYADNLAPFKRSVLSFTDLVNLLGRSFSYRNALNVYICRYDFFYSDLVLAFPPNNDHYSRVCGG